MANFKHMVPYELSMPEFLKRLQCEDVKEGQDALLTCQVIGDPGNFSFLRCVFFSGLRLFNIEIKQCQRFVGTKKTDRRYLRAIRDIEFRTIWKMAKQSCL